MTTTLDLDKALKGLTFDMVNNLTYGGEIDLEGGYTVYHYAEEDIIVLNKTEEWEEVYQLLLNHEEKNIVFECL